MPPKHRIRVSDLMSSQVVTLAPGQTLREATAILSDNHLSGAPVVEDENVVGVLSTTDVLDFIAANSIHEESTEPDALCCAADVESGAYAALIDRHCVREVMTRNVISVPAEADVVEAASYMFWAGIHRVLVMEGDSLLGVVSTMDIVQAVAQRAVPAA